MKVSFAIAASIGVFLAFWAAGFVISPDHARWCGQLPMGLGLPVFVLGGGSLVALAGIAPVAILALFSKDK